MSEPEQKPIIEKVKEYIPDSNDIKDAFNSATTAVSNGIENVKTGVQNTLGEFSEKGVTNASSEFLESNSVFAKFAFIILVLIIFLFLFKMGISLISYFTQASSSPYIIKGLFDGTSGPVSFTQDPNSSKSNYVPILRSVNQQNGIEWTWSLWLNLKYNKTDTINAANPELKLDTIFVKGPGDAGSFTSINSGRVKLSGICTVNGPGLYVIKNPLDGTVALSFAMDDIVNNTPVLLNKTSSVIDIPNVQLNKWVHVAFRLQNTIIDAYVNGIITQRLQLKNVPKQNYYDVIVGPNGQFQGQLSNLQYFNRALNVFEINNIVMFGPSLSVSKYSNNNNNATGNYSYLNTSWYSGWYNSG